ncbi:hypothetical protein CEXT_151311 [Caerostris extrusa]|uniref:Uncharacterized protein n=1 Tax=Caerostris extrusa TaxID=172846 RepID=A0AAV4SCQ8_CAEEX|nr:hypothetical protein CEXT_151311 [Caerostris extrusa]
MVPPGLELVLESSPGGALHFGQWILEQWVSDKQDHSQAYVISGKKNLWKQGFFTKDLIPGNPKLEPKEQYPPEAGHQCFRYLKIFTRRPSPKIGLSSLGHFRRHCMHQRSLQKPDVLQSWPKKRQIRHSEE